MDDVLKNLIKQFMPFAQKHIGFKKPPKLFLRRNQKNASDPLGKTAFYEPHSQSITLYITGRHPKDILRSLGHELVHHKQNCEGMFDDDMETGEGYAQTNPHLRQMEIEANRDGSMCLRDFEDGLKKNNTIYYEHLQKGDYKMSLKDWKEKEIGTLLSEAWGFKFNSLQEFEEFDGKGELQAEGEEELDEAAHEEDEKDKMKEAAHEEDEKDKMKEGAHEEDEKKKKDLDENVEGAFAPNHYCVHHGGVSRNGSIEMAEAISHNYNEELGKVTHYDMKFDDGTIMEGVPFEEIQVTNASLAQEHSHAPKRDDDEDEKVDERRARGRKTAANAQGRHDDERARLPEAKIREILKKAIQIVQENNKVTKKD